MSISGEHAGIGITSIAVRYEHDVVLARQRARQIAAHVGFESQEQVRFATAVSELARNAFQYAGGGRVSFSVEPEREHGRSVLVAQVADQGPGIADLDRILEGRYQSRTGMGLGILGARRLTDRFSIESEPGKGTRVRVGKVIAHAPPLDAISVAGIGAMLAREQANSPYEELQQQNQELLAALEELRASKANVDRLNQELEETNRGVVALYAELDDRANELKRLSETKTRFLSDMSHELRTPLTSLINLSGLLLSHADGELNTEQDTQVRLMKRSAESLAEMVNDLLDIAKIEAGRVDLRVEPVTVNELFGTLRGMFRPLITSDAVRLVFDEDSSIALYTGQVPSFKALLAREANDLPKFYARVKQLAALSKQDRDGTLAAAARPAIAKAP